jgi:hypothetical protein
MNYMRIYIFVILPMLLLTGCATTQGPEPTLPQTTNRVERAQPKQKSAPAVTQPRDTRQSTPPATQQQYRDETTAQQTDQQIVARAVEPKPRGDREDLYAQPRKPGETPAGGPSGWARLAEYNDNKLVNVYKGMDKATVEIIMASAHNPYKREKITGKDGQTYEVHFYLTREPRKGKPITEKLLTPVIFGHSEVVGMGNFQLKKLRTTGVVERKKRRAAQP